MLYLTWVYYTLALQYIYLNNDDKLQGRVLHSDSQFSFRMAPDLEGLWFFAAY
jgi:hypothetical protein